MTWDGEERRVDTTSIRLALLEKQAADAELRHKENQGRLDRLDLKISDLKSDFMYELGRGLDAIIEKMEADKKEMRPMIEKIVETYNCLGWVKNWNRALTAWNTAISAWILAHVGRH